MESQKVQPEVEARRSRATAKFLLRVVAAEQKNGINRPDADEFTAKMKKQAQS